MDEQTRACVKNLLGRVENGDVDYVDIASSLHIVLSGEYAKIHEVEILEPGKPDESRYLADDPEDCQPPLGDWSLADLVDYARSLMSTVGPKDDDEDSDTAPIGLAEMLEIDRALDAVSNALHRPLRLAHLPCALYDLRRRLQQDAGIDDDEIIAALTKLID